MYRSVYMHNYIVICPIFSGADPRGLETPVPKNTLEKSKEWCIGIKMN